MKIWCISDTHGHHAKLAVPSGIDMLIHAGDFGNTKEKVRNLVEANDFIEWLHSLDIQHKVVTPGNHDTSFLDYGIRDYFDQIKAHVLVHEKITLEGLKIFGSPYTPTYGQNWAFNVKRSRLQAVWQMIPDDLDILITHGPPKGVLDLTEDKDTRKMVQVGCKSLSNRVKQVKPKLHVFGHTHSEPKFDNHGLLIRDETKFINASVCTIKSGKMNPGIVTEVTRPSSIS